MDITSKPDQSIAPPENTQAPETNTPEEAVNEPRGIDILEEPYITNPFFYEVANYFGIEREDYGTAKDKLGAIVDWAYQETKSKKPEDILLAIRSAEDKLGAPEPGERRYTHLYRYIRLASQKQAVEKAMSAFERGNR